MKSVHNIVATKEEKQKLTSIGSAINPVKSYTKEDFLTPGKVAKKFNISTEEARKIMRKLSLKRAIFVLNNHKSSIIVKRGKNSTPYLHPMAIEAFQDYLKKERN